MASGGEQLQTFRQSALPAEPSYFLTSSSVGPLIDRRPSVVAKEKNELQKGWYMRRTNNLKTYLGARSGPLKVIAGSPFGMWNVTSNYSLWLISSWTEGWGPGGVVPIADTRHGGRMAPNTAPPKPFLHIQNNTFFWFRTHAIPLA